MIDVFVKVWASSRMRLAMAWTVLERLVMFEGARVHVVYAYPSLRIRGGYGAKVGEALMRAYVMFPDRFWITSKEYAEEHARSPIYVVIDDDHLPIGKDWLAAGVATLKRHPEYTMLASWSVNGEVYPYQNLGDRLKAEFEAAPYSPDDTDVFESRSSIGAAAIRRWLGTRGLVQRLACASTPIEGFGILKKTQPINPGGHMRPFPFVGIGLFSVIEALVTAVGFVVWQQNKVLGLIVWAIGYTIEHIVAFNVGRGKPFFSFERS